jgi:carboxymethylenebutenolidase
MRKFIKRFLLGLLALVLVAVIGLAGSIAVDSLSMGGRVAALTNVDIPNGTLAPIRAYVARPKTPGPHPAVIMVHEFWGVKQDINDKAEALAAEGYLVVAPDAFRGRTTALLPGAIYNVVATPAEQVDADMTVVFKWLELQPDVLPNRIAIMGFCFGGGTAINQAVSNPGIAATAVFYGRPVTEASRLKGLGPVMGAFGGADSSISVDSVRAFESGLNTAGVKNEIKIYDGQPHAFVTDMNAIRAGGAPGEAWAQLLRFLDANLKSRAAVPASAPVATRGQGGVARSVGFEYLAMLAYEHALGHRH